MRNAKLQCTLSGISFISRIKACDSYIKFNSDTTSNTKFNVYFCYWIKNQKLFINAYIIDNSKRQKKCKFAAYFLHN
jgi:hypothetical protein